MSALKSRSHVRMFNDTLNNNHKYYRGKPWPLINTAASRERDLCEDPERHRHSAQRPEQGQTNLPASETAVRGVRASAWREGFEDNNPDQQLAKLQTRLETLVSYFPDLKAGDVVLLDYIPGQGTYVSINGEKKGVIAGADFYAALLDVWLGEEPADDDLKEAMLGNNED